MGHSACVAILADKDKVEMEEEIRTKVPDTMGTRVVCRSGSPLDLDDLQIVSPDTARAIIVVSPGGQYPDLPVAKTMMALAKDRDRRAHRYHIVTALHRPTNLEITRMIGGDEAQVFLVDGLISRLIAQDLPPVGSVGGLRRVVQLRGRRHPLSRGAGPGGDHLRRGAIPLSKLGTDRPPVPGRAGPSQPADGDHDPAGRQGDRHRDRRRGPPSVRPRRTMASTQRPFTTSSPPRRRWSGS